MGVEDFLRDELRKLYSQAEVDSVPDISKREFGIGDFGKKISMRHLSFKSSRELNLFLREKAPFYISYSSALYDFPLARPMDAKKMVGADLVYEFDADEIKTSCKEQHDSWKCSSRTCVASGKGRVQKCPECGSGTVVEEWVCPECIAETRRQSMELISFLRDDFGFSEGISVNFSGSKGFHIHVRGEAVRGLSRGARLELLDYITATGLDLSALGFFYDKKKVKGDEILGKGSYVCPKRGAAKGWAKKILGRVAATFEENDVSRIALMGGIPISAAEKLLKEKDTIIRHMNNGLLAFPVKGVSTDKFWGHFLDFAIGEAKVELKVDRQTSVDMNKIVRVPETLHGSTGLLAKEVDVEKLGSFSGLDECVALPDSLLNISNASAPKFYLGGKWFGPFTQADVELPLYAAFYLLARGSASLGVK